MDEAASAVVIASHVMVEKLTRGLPNSYKFTGSFDGTLYLDLRRAIAVRCEAACRLNN
jgi:hypothetical protein